MCSRRQPVFGPREPSAAAAAALGALILTAAAELSMLNPLEACVQLDTHYTLCWACCKKLMHTSRASTALLGAGGRGAAVQATAGPWSNVPVVL